MKIVKNKSTELISVIALLVSLVVLLIGDNIVQQYFGKSAIDLVVGYFNPSSMPKSIRLYDSESLIPITDLHGSWDGASQVYCVQRVRIQNPTDAPQYLLNYFSKTDYQSGFVTLDGMGKSRNLVHTEDSPFKCIETTILGEKPIFQVLIPTSTPVPPTPSLSNSNDFDLDINIIVNSWAVAVGNDDERSCLSNSELEAAIVSIDQTQISLPITIDNPPIIEFYVMTRYFLDREKYEFSAFSGEGTIPVKLHHEFIDYSNMSISTPDYTCFFYKEK